MQTKSRSTEETTAQAKKMLNVSYYAATKLLDLQYLLSHATEYKFETKLSALIGAVPTSIPDAKDDSHIIVILCYSPKESSIFSMYNSFQHS